MKHSLDSLIGKVLRAYAREKSVEVPGDLEYDLTVAKDPAHGDFATNVAFKLARAAKQKPAAIAADLLPLFKNEGSAMLERIEIAGGGFINFFLTKSSLGKLLSDVLRADRSYGRSEAGKDKKVLLEFVSANPTGPLTIAHGRQAAVGDALARILRATGHKVQAEYYLNDAGRQMNLLGSSLYARYRELFGQEAPLPEDGYQGAYLIDIARELKAQKGDSLLQGPADKAADLCRKFAGDTIMEGIRQDLASVSVSFDSYFNETSLYEKDEVERTLGILRDRGFLFDHEGAQWFRSTDFGDDKDRVVKKSSGDYTYLAPDIAYHETKFERGFNWIVNFWGPDHHGYIARLKAACRALGHDAARIDVRIVQLTSLFRKGEPVRMSTRAGEFVTLRELVREVGPDATRFFFVMRRIESHLDFDLDLAKQKSQENPVYYLQYGHARIASLLKYAERAVNPDANVERLESAEEKDLIKIIGEFPDVLVSAGDALEPYRLADYLRDVAASFHKFYSQHRIVTDDRELTDARLLLAAAARITLRNGLELLGISQPESM